MTVHAAATQSIARICAVVGDGGVAVEHQFLHTAAILALAVEAHRRDVDGEFREAAVGRGTAQRKRRDVRGDRILWLDGSALTPPETRLFDALETCAWPSTNRCSSACMRSKVTMRSIRRRRSIARHLDRFRDDDARVLSCVLYLNGDWTTATAGCSAFIPPTAHATCCRIGGTLVCFLSDGVEHEVLPSRRERLAVTGWFKRRTSSL